jgi:4-carboxymuconolactone decarboxylase
MNAMPNPRIEPLPPPYSPDVAEDLRKLMPPGMEPLRLFTTLAHNPRVLGRVRRGGLLDPGAVSVRDREIVILRTTALCGAEYEWGVHVRFFAEAARLTPEQVAATASGGTEPFAPADKLLLDMCDALHRSARIDADLWARLSAGRQPAELIELVALAGQYHMVSYLASSLGIELEAGAARFPEP